MGTQDERYIDCLTDRQFDILKQELCFLEGRIIHLEGIQYRLRQFSIVLWSLTLTVGFGVTKLAEADARLIAASVCVPLVFGFLDAWYARAAQRFRTRRVDIAEFFNRTQTGTMSNSIYLLDMMASHRREKDPRARYRESLLTKLTRTIRLTFFSFQLLGSVALLVIFVLSGYASEWYLLVVTVVVLGLAILFTANRNSKKLWQSNHPEIPASEFQKRSEELFGSD